eukprot:TRINITY_DN16735_c0_g3_i1.p1 TRINITY_DN16735_c0_g3~~TRINITY_DN16735_c0_g3_i1.p1  ORF type:complete len:270 (-),score=86.29 TRINITY_DN16735_c0_g3_i1:145-954(-)
MAAVEAQATVAFVPAARSERGWREACEELARRCRELEAENEEMFDLRDTVVKGLGRAAATCGDEGTEISAEERDEEDTGGVSACKDAEEDEYELPQEASADVLRVQHAVLQARLVELQKANDDICRALDDAALTIARLTEVETDSDVESTGEAEPASPTAKAAAGMIAIIAANANLTGAARRWRKSALDLPLLPAKSGSSSDAEDPEHRTNDTLGACRSRSGSHSSGDSAGKNSVGKVSASGSPRSTATPRSPRSEGSNEWAAAEVMTN